MEESYFRDSRQRIARAIIHAKNIVRVWETLIDRDQIPEPEILKRGNHNFVASISLKYETENDLSLLIGEYFYQLRAALDAAMYRSMALQEGVADPLKADSVEFPIYTDRKRFDRSPVMKSSLPAEVKNWLRSIQPFAFENSNDSGDRELGRRLKILHDCARKDRHRRLHVTMATITNLETAFLHTPNLVISNIKPIPIDFLNGETDFLAFDVHVFEKGDTSIKLATGVTIEFAMAEIEGLAGNALLQELERVMLAVRHIVDVFEDGHKP